jgi:AraC-like DNA-binding protein
MRCIAGVLLMFAVAGPQEAALTGRQAAQPPALTAQRLLENLRTRRYSGRPMDLVVRDVRLATVLAELGRASELRFDVDPAIRDRVSYDIRSTPWDGILARVVAEHALRLDLDLAGTGFKIHRGSVRVLVTGDPTRVRIVAFLYRHLGGIVAALLVVVGATVAFAALRWRRTGRRPGAKKALLPPERAEETRRRLLALFETDRIHLREDLSLRDLAKALGITPHQLSWLINDGLDLSFSDLVNGYRIAVAKARLADPNLNSATILTVGFEAGFGTKAAFNRAFRKHTGMTPSEYRSAMQP